MDGCIVQCKHLLDAEGRCVGVIGLLVRGHALPPLVPLDVPHEAGPEAALPRPLRHLKGPDGLLHAHRLGEGWLGGG